MKTNTALISLFVVASFLVALSSADPLPTCRGLVLQGGSDKGAYQAGALQGILEALGSEEISYDVISGVTIGAVNAAWMSQFPKGMEEPMMDELLDFWLTMKSSDIYKDWAGGVIQGLLFEPALYDTTPGMQYLQTHVTQPPQRYVAIGTTNANNGTYKLWHNFNENLSVNDFLTSVMASTGIPGMFSYVNIGDSTFFDGSVLKSADFASVVNQCRVLTGGVDENIIIDTIMLTGHNLTAEESGNFNALQVLIRTLEIMSYHTANIGIIRAKQSYPNIKFRYYIAPSATLPTSYKPLGFSHDDVMNMIAVGKQDAKDAIEAGQGIKFDEAVEKALSKRKSGRGAPQTEAGMKKYFEQVNKAISEQKAAKVNTCENEVEEAAEVFHL